MASFGANKHKDRKPVKRKSREPRIRLPTSTFANEKEKQIKERLEPIRYETVDSISKLDDIRNIKTLRVALNRLRVFHSSVKNIKEETRTKLWYMDRLRESERKYGKHIANYLKDLQKWVKRRLVLLGKAEDSDALPLGAERVLKSANIERLGRNAKQLKIGMELFKDFVHTPVGTHTKSVKDVYAAQLADTEKTISTFRTLALDKANTQRLTLFLRTAIESLESASMRSRGLLYTTSSGIALNSAFLDKLKRIGDTADAALAKCKKENQDVCKKDIHTLMSSVSEKLLEDTYQTLKGIKKDEQLEVMADSLEEIIHTIEDTQKASRNKDVQEMLKDVVSQINSQLDILERNAKSDE